MLLNYPKCTNKKIEQKFSQMLLRIKRGFNFDTPYVFLKDWNYWKGYQLVAQQSDKDRNNLWLGKISSKHIKILAKLGFPTQLNPSITFNPQQIKNAVEKFAGIND
jgi:hypothetical protein